MTNRHTRNKMVALFKDHKWRRRLLNFRNWCEVEEIGAGGDPKAVAKGGKVGGGRGRKLRLKGLGWSKQEDDSANKAMAGDMVYTLRVEDKERPPEGGLGPGRMKAYASVVPTLEKRPKAGKAKADLLDYYHSGTKGTGKPKPGQAVAEKPKRTAFDRRPWMSA